MANFSTSFASFVDTGGKFATDVNDAGSKFVTGVIDVGGNNGSNYQSADNLKWTWQNKFIYMLTLLPKGVQKKSEKIFWLKIFSICHRCQGHRWQILSCKYLRKFSKKFETALGARGKLFHEKNLEAKNLLTLSL